ncbi:hypothetical protein HS99_0010000 [Kitasatospora aureofaciens]|uniref:Aminotransferase class V domain-containing protein n=1 Tax=Kitasatospora aureofaciens TaxID=1894 RepID=A0A1E7N276_KITAU|nr:hypothetical protein B6264_25740 [Kitasatospora aureofaciens]OEV34798.1 hypothetical protein HS99_0010000 [Kitasatospora aureofaciens]GGU92548.1 hypothetical protein GCM10010502_52530 [Kitasatospora aureofaciens]
MTVHGLDHGPQCVPVGQMLRVVALLGRAFSAVEMMAVLQRPATELLTPVAEAIAAGVLEERGDLLAFRHDLIRRVVVQSYSQAVRTALYRQIGVALAAMNAPVERVAEHLLEAAQLGESDQLPPRRPCMTTTDHSHALHHNFVVALLNDLFGIQARGGCSCAGPYGHRLLGIGEEHSGALRDEVVMRGREGIKPGWTRVSFPYFMSDTVRDFIIEAVDLIATEGHRLLPDYRFTPGSGLWRHRLARRNSR